MAALSAALDERMRALSDERCQKQSSRLRLTADPNISVCQIQKVLTQYLHHKSSKDMWALICPPPSGPITYGWHTHPHGEWLSKVAGLLFDLLEIAPNSKLQSVKLVKSLKAMHANKDLEVQPKKGQSCEDVFDQIDLTVRILMSMVRSLKLSPVDKAKVWRSIPRKDQVCLEMVLEKVVLPAEFMKMNSSSSSLLVDDETNVGESVTMAKQEENDSRQCTAMVPYKGPPEPQPAAKAGKQSIKPLPNIFSKINSAKESSTMANESMHKVPDKQKQTPAGKPSGQAKAEDLLAKAMSYQAASLKEKPASKQKAKAKAKAKGTKKAAKPTQPKKTSKAPPKVSPKKTNQAKKDEGHKKCKEAGNAEGKADGSSYKPGLMMQQRDEYIQEYMASGEHSRAEASESWAKSIKRAMLLKDLSLPELKRRRFVGKECQTNPFAEMVANAAEEEPEHEEAEDVE